MKRTLLSILILFGFTLTIFGQSVTNTSVKVDHLIFPALSLENISTTKISIYPGNNTLAPKDIKNKNGGLQAIQDNINNVTPSFYDYKGIKNVGVNPDSHIEIAFGDFTIASKELKSHKIPCKQKSAKLTKENIFECDAYYYEVKYTLPTVLIIKDKSGNALYADAIVSMGTTTFGYDKSGLSGHLKQSELDNTYNGATTASDLAKMAMSDRLDMLTISVQRAYFFLESKSKVDIASGKGGFDYTDLESAQANAIEGLAAISDSKDGSTKLNVAIKVWGNAVKDLDMNEKKARINRKIASELYMNMAKAYYYLNDPENGITSINEALKLLKFESNLNRIDEAEALRKDLYNQKSSIGSIEANKIILNNSRIEAPILLNEARGKEKDAAYTYILPGEKFNELKEIYKSINAEEQSNKEGTSPSGNSSEWSNYVTQSATQGYFIMKMYTTSITEVPDEIGELSHLNQIILNNCRIASVSPEIGKLVNLKVLNLSNNQINSLPEELSNCTSLEKLKLKNNQLKTLPKRLENCTNLKTLDISGNQIPQSEIDTLQSKLGKKCKIKF